MSAVATERPRILLVDDSLVMRKAASKMLGEEFDIVTAADGEEGWQRVQADTTIQVVFTDLMMPRVDGYQLLRFIRTAEDEGTLNMPVIIVTGAENDESAREKALEMGATDFITKPFSSVDLLARARVHANYRRIARKLEQQTTLDALTGLANKAGFVDHLQQDLAFARRLAQPLTLVRIEIDSFRNLFLAHGKLAAEAIVRHVATVLHERIRKEDTAARLGLASFALAMPAGQHDGSKGLIERLRAQFAGEPVDVDGKAITVTISAAVVTPDLHESPDAVAVLEACEALLQQAVKAGGNRVIGHATPDEHVAPLTPSAAASVAVPVAPPLPGAAAPAVLPATAAPDADSSLDLALRQIEQGDTQPVIAQLPVLLKRLMPLFRLLGAKQRGQLVAYLQKLGA